MSSSLRVSSALLAALLLGACASTPDQGDGASSSDNDQAQRQAMADDTLRDETRRRCQRDGTRRSGGQQQSGCPSQRGSSPLEGTTSTLEDTVTRPLGGLGQGNGPL